MFRPRSSSNEIRIRLESVCLHILSSRLHNIWLLFAVKDVARHGKNDASFEFYLQTPNHKYQNEIERKKKCSRKKNTAAAITNDNNIESIEA